MCPIALNEGMCSFIIVIILIGHWNRNHEIVGPNKWQAYIGADSGYSGSGRLGDTSL